MGNNSYHPILEVTFEVRKREREEEGGEGEERGRGGEGEGRGVRRGVGKWRTLSDIENGK